MSMTPGRVKGQEKVRGGGVGGPKNARGSGAMGGRVAGDEGGW